YSRRLYSFIEFVRGLDSASARLDDVLVGWHAVLARAMLERAHALLHRGVLHGEAFDAGEGAAFLLRLAVHQIVVVLVRERPEGARHQWHVNALPGDHGVALVLGERPRGVVVGAPGPAVLVVHRHQAMAADRMVAARR